jgi:hypothetical protein
MKVHPQIIALRSMVTSSRQINEWKCGEMGSRGVLAEEEAMAMFPAI